MEFTVGGDGHESGSLLKFLINFDATTHDLGGLDLLVVLVFSKGHRCT